jgi:HEAT repeat protein
MIKGGNTMSLSERKQALVSALQDPEELVRAAASRALDRVEGIERMQNIFEAASSGEKPHRIRAIHFLGFLNTPESVDRMLAFLQDPEPDIRVATVRAIQVHLPGRALVPLLGALEDPDNSVVQVVIETLSHYHDPKITEFLLPYLHGPDQETACVAAEALGRNGDPRSEPVLIKVLQEATDPFLKVRTAEALGNLRPGT